MKDYAVLAKHSEFALKTPVMELHCLLNCINEPFLVSKKFNKLSVG